MDCIRTLLVGSCTMLLLRWPCSAQQQAPVKNPPPIYLSAALGNGTHGTARLGMDVIFDGRHSISCSFLYSVSTSPDKPSGFDYYNSGLFDLDLTGHKQPLNHHRLFSLSAGRVFVRRAGKARFHAKAGMLFGASELAGNFVFVPDTGSGWFDNAHYDYSYHTTTTYGGQLQLVLELLPNQVFGLRTAANIGYTNNGIQAGLEAGFNLGYLRPRLSHCSK